MDRSAFFLLRTRLGGHRRSTASANRELMSHSTGRTDGRLLRHDRMIVANELRSAFASWTDRLVALAVILIALAAVRASLSDRPFVLAATAVAALGAVAGAGAAWMIDRRLDFHAQDGVIAADALTDRARRHYILSIHAPVCGMVTLCAGIGRPMAAFLVPLAYLIGAGACHIARRLAIPGGGQPRSSRLRAARRVLQRPISGAVAAIPAVLPLLLLESIDPGPLAAFAGLVSTVAVMLLTMVDYNTVRFMSASGYRSGRIIGIHGRSLLVFIVLSVPAALALSDGLAAIVISGVGIVAFMLMTARILAYRIHSKRAADTAVSICVAVVAFTGFAMPMLLPFVVIAILWHLHRRSAPATWLLT